MTYSITARCPDTARIGVAVQSHHLGVGSVVPWLESGVGAIATQSLVEVSYGPLGLALLKAGRSPEETLAGLVAADAGQAVRQVGVVAADGSAAAHTGRRCIAAAGHLVLEGATVQANMMRDEGVPEAMAASWSASAGEPLEERLLRSLEAAQEAGGDIRGQQSAALVVVAAEPSGRPWQDRQVDLRVEDAAAPLPELRRLVGLRRAYAEVDRGDALTALGDTEAAAGAYALAGSLAPGHVELAFWRGVGLAATGREDEAAAFLAVAYADHDGWAELLRRLPASGLFAADAELLGRVLPPG